MKIKHLKELVKFLEIKYGEEEDYYFEAEPDVIYTHLTIEQYPPKSEIGRKFSEWGLQNFEGIWGWYT